MAKLMCRLPQPSSKCIKVKLHYEKRNQNGNISSKLKISNLSSKLKIYNISPKPKIYNISSDLKV